MNEGHDLGGQQLHKEGVIRVEGKQEICGLQSLDRYLVGFRKALNPLRWRVNIVPTHFPEKDFPLTEENQRLGVFCYQEGFVQTLDRCASKRGICPKIASELGWSERLPSSAEIEECPQKLLG